MEEEEEEEKQQQQKGPHSATSISSIRSNEADGFSIGQVSAQGSRIIAPFSDIPPKQAFDWWHKINYLNKVSWATKVLRHKNAEAKEEFCKKIADAEREYLIMTRNRAAYQERSNQNFRSKTNVNGRTFYTPNKGRKSDRPVTRGNPSMPPFANTESGKLNDYQWPDGTQSFIAPTEIINLNGRPQFGWSLAQIGNSSKNSR